MIPRWMHRLYARLTGNYWLPCPMCGKMFGGHEVVGDCYFEDIDGSHDMCPACEKEKLAEMERERPRAFGRYP